MALIGAMAAATSANTVSRMSSNSGRRNRGSGDKGYQKNIPKGFKECEHCDGTGLINLENDEKRKKKKEREDFVVNWYKEHNEELEEAINAVNAKIKAKGIPLSIGTTLVKGNREDTVGIYVYNLDDIKYEAYGYKHTWSSDFPFEIDKHGQSNTALDMFVHDSKVGELLDQLGYKAVEMHIDPNLITQETAKQRRTDAERWAKEQYDKEQKLIESKNRILREQQRAKQQQEEQERWEAQPKVSFLERILNWFK